MARWSIPWALAPADTWRTPGGHLAGLLGHLAGFILLLRRLQSPGAIPLAPLIPRVSNTHTQSRRLLHTCPRRLLYSCDQLKLLPKIKVMMSVLLT